MEIVSKKRELDGGTVRADKPAKRAALATRDPSPRPVANTTISHGVAREIKSFSDLGIIKELCQACDALGFKAPRPIQVQAIPQALAGRDIIGLAETGSGKTAAFGLPMLQALMEKPQPLFGLVLAPTRELATQIKKHIESLGSIINVRCVELTGGMEMMPQSIALGKKPHIIIATPGRLLDHLENTKGFSLRNIKYLIFDEADKLLDLNFTDSINKILKVLPRERHTYLFSATMSDKVGALQRASLKDPIRVSVSSENKTVEGLVQEWMLVPAAQKDIYLIYYLKDQFQGAKVIIFARTINKTQELAYLLRALGFSAIPIHGDLPQSARTLALGKFTTGDRNILVATDVAARGLDIRAVDLVLNYDLPDNSETYLHRVGRTARAGNTGRAISMVTQYDAELWPHIENFLKRQLPQLRPPREEVMILADSVNEAQLDAKRKMRDYLDKGKRRGGGGIGNGRRRGRDRERPNDREER